MDIMKVHVSQSYYGSYVLRNAPVYCNPTATRA